MFETVDTWLRNAVISRELEMIQPSQMDFELMSEELYNEYVQLYLDAAIQFRLETREEDDTRTTPN